ncbi:hypothetical protein DFP72DRAFT_1070668 [Ephemerocybe angulata]|uniref:C2H2-type domain-containing protein n=1 Tax=Ephemerocybe angulata TaxID=980116 RepID=A0A8H6HSQ4_9AGAR|nr:hypothetical protein DFP72DRAFT_1070668 [Tulosesus angulatus]
MHLNIITLLPVFAALASNVNGYYPDGFDARDYADDLTTREINQVLLRREMITELADFSSRDLLDAISIQLERRGSSLSKGTSRWTKNEVIDPNKSRPVHKPRCFFCNKEFATQGEATACGNNHPGGGGSAKRR